MRARLRNVPTKDLQAAVDRELEKRKNEFAVRIFKLWIYQLHMLYGFGTTRIKRLYDAIENSIDEMENDPIFWDRVDKKLIDELNIEFPREDYEHMENIYYKSAEKISMKEAAEMQKNLQQAKNWALTRNEGKK